MKKKTLRRLLISHAVLFICLTASARNPPFNRFKEIRLGAAVCRMTDSTLIVNSGQIERTYRITPWGLRTTGLRFPHGKEQQWNGVCIHADWELGPDSKAEWNNITAGIEDDSGFTTRHITVINEFKYAGIGVRLRYIIWVYPGSGIRTQIEMKALKKDGRPSLDFERQQTEFIPVQPAGSVITAFGYYNDTQHRNTDTTFVLKEEWLSTPAVVDWANGLLIRQGAGGWVLVKESHKCVNQPGVATGGFEVGQDGIAITGLGLAIKDLDTGAYKKCWANWIIPYSGDSTDASLALKKFDRIRYPVRASDQYIMANTWGNSDNSMEGQGPYAARQENVLKEIASQGDLGIDVQQIDDGWQGQGYKQWKPVDSAVVPSKIMGVQGMPYAVYPDGWSKVKEYAARENVKLGLWAAWNIPQEDLKWNYNSGGFKYVKLDFAVLNTKERLDAFMAKVRSFVLYSHNTVRINWDVTENAPRTGYFYAREFGNVWLENRKPVIPANVIYNPHLVLRDAWQLAKYTNLNQFQLAFQNKDIVDKHASNAYLYPNAYCVAITLMGSPMFFGLTHLYAEEGRRQIKNMLQAYKRDRNGIYKGYVFPIGDMPDDASWPGFQDVISREGTGYLLIFRELKNKKDSASLRLQFLHHTFIELTDLLNGTKKKLFVDKEGFATFAIPRSADFRLYRYKTIDETIH